MGSAEGCSAASSRSFEFNSTAKSTARGWLRALVTRFGFGLGGTGGSDPDFGKGLWLDDVDESFFAELEDGQKRDNDSVSTFFSDK